MSPNFSLFMAGASYGVRRFFQLASDRPSPWLCACRMSPLTTVHANSAGCHVRRAGILQRHNSGGPCHHDCATASHNAGVCDMGCHMEGTKCEIWVRNHMPTVNPTCSVSLMSGPCAGLLFRSQRSFEEGGWNRCSLRPYLSTLLAGETQRSGRADDCAARRNRPHAHDGL